MITKSDVKKLSELSRIDLSEKEKGALATDLESILGYFEKLKEIRTAGITEARFEEVALPSLRSDKEGRAPFGNMADLVSAAPDAESGYIKVKPVFDRA